MPETPDRPPRPETNAESARQGLSFDIIVATLGRTTELARLLESLAVQSEPLRLIVVDQNGDERLAPILERYADTVRLLRLRSSPGLSHARNAGLQALDADVVAFADDDCWYPPTLLAQVNRLLNDNIAWGGVTGRVTDRSGRPSSARWSSRAGVVNRGNVWTRGVSISMFVRRGVVQGRSANSTETLGVGAGTAWGSGEETDYLLRAIQHGVAIHDDPGLAVYHPQTNRQVTPAVRSAVGHLYGAGVGSRAPKARLSVVVCDLPCRPSCRRRCLGRSHTAIPTEAKFFAAVAQGRAGGWWDQEKA